jgi:HEAT repeat protein
LGSLSKPAIPSLRKLAHNSKNSSTSKNQWAQGEAAAALILLGAESLDSCIDKLLDPKNHDWKSAWWAIVALRTNAASAVPRLAQAFHASNDQEFRGRIAFPLRFIRSYPELSVPILKSLLGHEDKSVRFQAIAGLANFGEEAKTALPELRDLLQSDPSHREILTHTITRIESASRETKRSELK